MDLPAAGVVVVGSLAAGQEAGIAVEGAGTAVAEVEIVLVACLAVSEAGQDCPNRHQQG